MILKTLIFAPEGRDEMRLDLTGDVNALLLTVSACAAFLFAVCQSAN